MIGHMLLALKVNELRWYSYLARIAEVGANLFTCTSMWTSGRGKLERSEIEGYLHKGDLHLNNDKEE
jgi:hypothetical protein